MNSIGRSARCFAAFGDLFQDISFVAKGIGEFSPAMIAAKGLVIVNVSQLLGSLCVIARFEKSTASIPAAHKENLFLRIDPVGKEVDGLLVDLGRGEGRH